MIMKKLLIALLAMVMLAGTMVIPASADTYLLDAVEYENDLMISAYWAPHIAIVKTNKFTVSNDVPYKSSKSSLRLDYDFKKTNWAIYYYTLLEPDAVELKEYITFCAKADFNRPMRIAVINSDHGYYKEVNLTTEWQRFSVPVSELVDNATGISLTESYAEKQWISNVTLGMDWEQTDIEATPEADGVTGTLWVDDIAFVDKADLAGLPQPEKKTDSTTTKKPDGTTTKKPDGTTTKKPDGTTTTTVSPSTTTVDGTSSTDSVDVTTTTTGTVDTDTVVGALNVLDEIVKLDGDKLIVPEGMTVSNVLSRLKAEDGCEMSIVKEGVSLDSTEKITAGMNLVIAKDGATLKTYVLELASDDSDNAGSGWLLPVCIVAGLLLIAGVLLFVFRDKIFKKSA